MSEGATVRSIVAIAARGQLLHELEYHDDIFIISRGPGTAARETEEWILRSDRFPSKWNARYVSIFITPQAASIEFRHSNDRVCLKRPAPPSEIQHEDSD